ncbi:MAG: T9SS C-terminal target domain-containing protein, partial [Chlorobi bacterium CHB2]|nr:T9SS C-terminal target domain-containing protein [Chlorobi bacterium CHB2]
DFVSDSLAVDTCGINPMMNRSCEYFRGLLLSGVDIIEERYYAKGPWYLQPKDSTIVLPPMPARYGDTIFFRYQDLADSTLRSIFFDIEQRYGSLSLYRVGRGDENRHLFIYFDNYVHVVDISQYFDSLNYFTHDLWNGIGETSGDVDITHQNQKQNFQLINNVVEDFLKIEIYDINEKHHAMQIHDMYGKRIIDNKITATSPSLSIDVSTLPIGMYIISMGSSYQLFHIMR